MPGSIPVAGRVGRCGSPPVVPRRGAKRRARRARSLRSTPGSRETEFIFPCDIWLDQKVQECVLTWHSRACGEVLARLALGATNVPPGRVYASLEPVIELVIVRHALLGVLGFLRVFQQNARLQLGRVLLANPREFQLLFFGHGHLTAKNAGHAKSIRQKIFLPSQRLISLAKASTCGRRPAPSRVPADQGFLFLNFLSPRIERQAIRA